MDMFDRVNYVNRIIRIAYSNQGVVLDSSDLISPTEFPSELSALLKYLAASAGRRLVRVLPEISLLETPLIRDLAFEDVEIKIGIINEQGKEWYLSSSLEMFDFVAEAKAGLLPAGGTIFDIGAHQGVWSMYYCLRDRSTTVYCFEPSVINVEAICINVLLNNVDNLRIIPSAVGTSGTDTSRRDASADMLVDFVGEHIHVVNFENFASHQVDFAKVDIEGFEFDLLKKFDWFFEFSKHYHLELHVPHLQHRGVDYREAFEKIPFEKFSVTDWQSGVPKHVDATSELSGFTTLMIKRK